MSMAVARGTASPHVARACCALVFGSCVLLLLFSWSCLFLCVVFVVVLVLFVLVLFLRCCCFLFMFRFCPGSSGGNGERHRTSFGRRCGLHMGCVIP